MLSTNFEKPDPLVVFSDYVRLKYLFRNVMKWNPDKKPFSQDALDSRPDFKSFYIAAKKYDCRSEIVDRLVSGFLQNKDFYIINMYELDYIEFHNKRFRTCSSLLHTWKTDIEKIQDFQILNSCPVSELLSKKKVPEIIKKSRRIIGGVSMETLAILNYYFGFCENITTNDPLWESQSAKIKSYSQLFKGGNEYELELEKLLKVTKSANSG